MLQRLQELKECGVEKGHLKKDVKYFGHMQVLSTECPGKVLYEYITKLPEWTANPTKQIAPEPPVLQLKWTLKMRKSFREF